MKKTLYILMLIVVASQLKAQSLQTQPFNNLLAKPFSKLPNDSFSKKYFDNRFDSLKTTHYSQQLFANSEKSIRFSNLYAYDRMPVAKLRGFSKMPIIKPNINSKMPIVYLDDLNKMLNLKTEPNP